MLKRIRKSVSSFCSFCYAVALSKNYRAKIGDIIWVGIAFAVLAFGFALSSANS